MTVDESALTYKEMCVCSVVFDFSNMNCICVCLFCMICDTSSGICYNKCDGSPLHLQDQEMTQDEIALEYKGLCVFLTGFAFSNMGCICSLNQLRYML